MRLDRLVSALADLGAALGELFATSSPVPVAIVVVATNGLIV